MNNKFFEDGKYIGPVIVIAGPTASGKTGAAIKAAKEIAAAVAPERAGEIFGEVISADSRAIYKYMNIGTAKPTAEEMDGVPHFGFDLVEPGERFTVADFKNYAEEKIAEIRARGHVPIVAGGTGLYVDALIFGYHFSEEAKKNYSDRKKMLPGFLAYGISWEPSELRERLTIRAKQMYRPELFDETKFLVERYGWGSQAMKSNIYQFAWSYLQGEMSLDEAISKNVYDDWHLAKRQMTWFKRNHEMRWVRLDKIVQTVLSDISNYEAQK